MADHTVKSPGRCGTRTALSRSPKWKRSALALDDEKIVCFPAPLGGRFLAHRVLRGKSGERADGAIQRLELQPPVPAQDS
jgi:hypothetical protein